MTCQARAGWRRRSLVAKDVLLATMALLLLGAAYTCVVVVRRQGAINAVSRYNLTWIVSQAGLEVSRLDTAVAAAMVPGGGADDDEIDLRLSIVENRMQLLESGEVAEFVATSAEMQNIMNGFRAAVREARAELDGHEGQQLKLLQLVNSLNTPIAHLAAAANAYSGDLDAADRRMLGNLQWLFAAILGMTTACGLFLVAALTWHNRKLIAAQLAERQQTKALEERDAELQTTNRQFDAALNNMSQALCMMDGEGHLLVCNVRFLHMFGLRPHDAEQGTPAAALNDAIAAAGYFGPDVLAALAFKQERFARGRASATFVEEGVDGRALAVSQEPMADGGWVATFEEITERRRTEAQIRFMANHDALTGLPNRRQFLAKLEDALTANAATGTSVAILCLDLDQFKQVNDTLGHPAGDTLLKTVASRLLSCVREGDLVARLGGDEFAVLQTGAVQPISANATAGRIVDVLSAHFQLDDNRTVIGTSIGIAVAAPDLVGADGLLKSADIALYRAKSEGRGTWRMFEPAMASALHLRRALEQDLRDAVAQEALEIFYQPLHHVASDMVSGFEALLRWRHPRDGMIAPGIFIPIAEEIGLIATIGEWVLRKACSDAASWPDGLRVAVNLSPLQFRDPGPVRAVEQALLSSGLPSSRLELEITESVLLQDSESVLATLQELRRLGLHIALDDFGTGYSSLSYLRSFPFSKVKIDRSFIQEVAVKPNSEAIVRAVTDLARTLGMATTAEGVESEDQFERLKECGCTEMQGFLFDRPRPVEEITRWFPSNRLLDRRGHSLAA